MRRSAGLLPFRRTTGRLEVLLTHPGGPYFAGKDAGVWTLAKGMVEEGETELAVARRELEEETGMRAPAQGYLDLGEVRQKGGKWVRAWAFEGDFDPAAHTSNTFELEWPRGSGQVRTFPEVDRIEWLAIPQARDKILESQRELLERLVAALAMRA